MRWSARVLAECAELHLLAKRLPADSATLEPTLPASLTRLTNPEHASPLARRALAAGWTVREMNEAVRRTNGAGRLIDPCPVLLGLHRALVALQRVPKLLAAHPDALGGWTADDRFALRSRIGAGRRTLGHLDEMIASEGRARPREPSALRRFEAELEARADARRGGRS